MLSRILKVGLVGFTVVLTLSSASQSPTPGENSRSIVQANLVGTWSADQYIIQGGTSSYDLLRNVEFQALSLTLSQRGKFRQKFSYADGSGYELVGNWVLDEQGSKVLVEIERVNTFQGEEKKANYVSIAYKFNIVSLTDSTWNFDFLNHEYQMDVTAEWTKLN